MFRSFKSELGLRPIFHAKEVRTEGHLFITVLAYQCVQLIRTELKQHGIDARWGCDRHLHRRRSYVPHLRRYGLAFHSRLGVDYKFLEGGGSSRYRLLEQPLEQHPSWP